MSDAPAPVEATEAIIDPVVELVAEPALLADAGAPAPEGDKPAEEPKPEGEEPKVEDDKPAEPDTTAFEGLVAPEGFAAIDADLLTAATPLMRAQGIDTPEKAQEFVNAFAPVLAQATEKALTAAAEAQTAGISKQTADWVAESRADKEFGGAKFDENMALAAKFRDRLVTTEAGKALLREAPIMNHPEIVRLFVKGGQLLAEDSIHRSDHGQQQPKSMGATFYGDMKPVDSSNA